MKTNSGLQMVQLVWVKTGKIPWTTLNHSLHTGLFLAIGAQLRFESKDLEYINQHIYTGRWLNWEHAYAHAIVCENREFILAFEEWMKREPFFANDVRTIDASGFVHRNCGCERKRERLALYFHIGRNLKVTSINNERVVLSEYSNPNDRKPKCIHKLTHAQLAERYPAAKKSQKKP